jgi:transcriptional regulator with XRE-family HTH domain
MPKKSKKKVRAPRLQYLGERIKAARNKNHLTKQELADQAGIGLRHYQNIESGLINPSYKVLSAIVQRLAMPSDILFYPDISQQEEEKQHLLSKFAACTEMERKFLLNTVNCMVGQFINRRHEETSEETPE